MYFLRENSDVRDDKRIYFNLEREIGMLFKSEKSINELYKKYLVEESKGYTYLKMIQTNSVYDEIQALLLSVPLEQKEQFIDYVTENHCDGMGIRNWLKDRIGASQFTCTIDVEKTGNKLGNLLERAFSEAITLSSKDIDMSLAKIIKETFALCLKKSNSDNLLIYNKLSGVWEDSENVIKRYVINLVQKISAYNRMVWSIHLEKRIIDILVRTVEIVDDQLFNQRYFPFANVTLDTKTVKMVPHHPNHYATISSPVKYDPSLDCPEFNRCLDDAFFGDNNLKLFLAELFGYVLDASHKANVFVIAVGSGSNGKSTIFDTLQKLIGIENVASTPLSNMNTSFGLQPLLGKKLNLSTESDAVNLNTGRLKAITAGEQITVNQKNKPEIQVVLPTKLIYLMNELPYIDDASYGLSRRLIILPFMRQFKPSEQNKDLSHILSRELSGILNFALEGLCRLKSNNYQFTESKSMEEMKGNFLNTIKNPVHVFADELVLYDQGSVLEGKLLINIYTEWLSNHPEINDKGTTSPRVFWKYFIPYVKKINNKIEVFKGNGVRKVRNIEVCNMDTF